MANQSAKKLSLQNQNTLKFLLIGNTISSVFLLIFNGLEVSVLASFVLIWGLLFYLYKSVYTTGNFNMKYSKADLQTTLFQYVMDIIYISWLVHIGGAIHSFFWILYWTIPIFIVYKAASFCLPMLKR